MINNNNDNNDKMINQSLLSIRTISNIYNFKLYRIVFKLKA